MTGLSPARPDLESSVTNISASRLRVWILCGAFTIAWLLPYHTYPFSSFYSDYVSGIGVVSGLLLLCAARSKRPIDLPLCALLPLAMAAWIAGQVALGQLNYRQDAILPIGYLLAAAGATILGAEFRSPDAYRSSGSAHSVLALALVIAASLSAFITFFQYFGVDILLGDWSVAFEGDGKTAMRPYANLGQPNQLALLLCWALAGLWSLFQRRWLNGVAGCVLALVLLTSLAFTQSKIAWMIVPVFVALAAIANKRDWARRVPAMLLLGLTAYFVALVLLLPTLGQLSGTPTEAVGQRMATNGVRSVMILQGFFIGFQHPLAGVGWLGFPAHQVMVASQFGETQYAMHAHNLIANLSAELGWIATALIIGTTAYWMLINFVKTPLNPMRHFALMIFAAVGIHSMVEFPLWYAYFLLPVFFIAGLVEAPREGRRAIVVPRGLVLGVVLGGALVLTLIASDYRRVVQSFRALGYERIGWNYPEGSTERPQWTMFPQFYDYIAFADVRPTIRMTAEQIAAYERVAKRFGYAPVLMRMATIYALNGRADDAVATMDAVRHLYRPRYPEAYRAWEALAHEYPEVLGKVYARLPPPS